MFVYSFKQQYSFEKRCLESERILNKYPGRFPIICEKTKNSSVILPDLNKHKYLVPADLTIGHFICIIRKKLHLEPQDALMIFIDNNVVSSSSFIGELYDQYKDEDGFLYTEYSKENTFG
jgi:GABA(A) receptor-associated protein